MRLIIDDHRAFINDLIIQFDGVIDFNAVSLVVILGIIQTGIAPIKDNIIRINRFRQTIGKLVDLLTGIFHIVQFDAPLDPVIFGILNGVKIVAVRKIVTVFIFFDVDALGGKCLIA